MAFRDRTDAGERLAEELATLDLDHPIIFGMARGGVPVAFEIARHLRAPLDVIVVRKLGHPAQPELGLGALAEGGVRVMNERLLEQLRVPADLLDRVAREEEVELERRLSTYRGDMKEPDTRNRTVIVVDDGLATGFTAMAAVAALRKRGASRVVLAVPVAPPTAVATLETLADDVVCLDVTEHFFGLSEWYADFRQVSDDKVIELLARAALTSSRGSTVADASSDTASTTSTSNAARVRDVTILSADSAGSAGSARPGLRHAARGRVGLAGRLAIPPGPRGLVLFAHGSGSSRLSPRNTEVAEALQRAGLATLLFDLLTEEEASARSSVFDIGLLARRIEAAVDWIDDTAPEDLTGIPLGFFGASTGAAAALVAAAHLGSRVAAVVSRGGRPDLAGVELGRVTVATLLVVGGRDDIVLELNRQATSRLHAEHRLVVVPGATHLFEEPGALGQVADLAAEWFGSHFGRRVDPEDLPSADSARQDGGP